MKLAAHQVDNFLQSMTAENVPRLILVYGPDSGGVREIIQKLRRTYLGSEADPLQLAQIDERDLSGDRAALATEAAAIPMFGGNKLVHVRGGGAPVSAAVAHYLENPSPDALVLVEAGALKPSSGLRKAAEASKQAMAMPCYELEARDMARLARDHLEKHGLNIEAAALQALVGMLATDRGILQRELERLVLFMGSEAALVTMDDIDAAMGDIAQSSVDALVDNIALGKIDAADQALDRLVTGGRSVSSLLGAIRGHFQTLHLAAAMKEKGVREQQIFAGFRPPLHFRRKPLVTRQLELWSSGKITRALTLLQNAERFSRSGATSGAPGLDDAQAGQVLLRIARAARL
jgi:DNA polymerase-3 subunit delta